MLQVELAYYETNAPTELAYCEANTPSLLTKLKVRELACCEASSK